MVLCYVSPKKMNLIRQHIQEATENADITSSVLSYISDILKYDLQQHEDKLAKARLSMMESRKKKKDEQVPEEKQSSYTAYSRQYYQAHKKELNEKRVHLAKIKRSTKTEKGI